MQIIDRALLVDAKGSPIKQHHRTQSSDWDEVQEFCDKVYMPFRVRPLGNFLKPRATMYSTHVNRITVTRFCYGVPIHLQDFDPGAGNILVLTTLRGSLQHSVNLHENAVTVRGESFVADCSKTEYSLDGDEKHLQLNLTIPHAVMEDIALQWFDFVPDDRLWQSKVKFGGANSAWIGLLEYMVRSIAEAPDRVRYGRVGAHLEEAICVELLRNWADQAGINLEGGAQSAAPHYVRQAEQFIEDHANSVPTVAEIAKAANISVRALSGAFQNFRGTSPSAYLREQRLLGVRRALLGASRGDTVASIASQWGYVNFGVFAKAYRRRFGELPSQTLGRAGG